MHNYLWPISQVSKPDRDKYQTNAQRHCSLDLTENKHRSVQFLHRKSVVRILTDYFRIDKETRFGVKLETILPFVHMTLNSNQKLTRLIVSYKNLIQKNCYSNLETFAFRWE